MIYDEAKKMFSVGDMVRIKDNGLRHTHLAHGTVKEMHQMVGQKFRVTSIFEFKATPNNIAGIEAGGYLWGAEDLYIVEKYYRHEKLITTPAQTDVLMFDPIKLQL